MNRRQFIQFAGAAAFGSQFPFAWADTPSPITIYGPGALPSLLLGVARHRQQQGLSAMQQTFNVETWRTPDVLRAGLANGSIQASIVPSYVAVNLSNRGLDVKLVNIMTWGLVDIIGSADSISSLKDLEGRSIAVPLRNDMPDLVLQALCKLQGVDFKKIAINYTATPAEALTYWLNDRAEFALLNEPLTSVAMMKGKSKSAARVLNLREIWRNLHDGKSQGLPQAGLLVTQAFYEQNQEFLRHLQTELQSSLQWTLTNSAEASKIGNKLLDIPSPAIKAAIPHANLTVAAAAEIREDLMLFFNTLYNLNPQILGNSMPKENFILKL